MPERPRIVLIGAGIVGLATARALLEREPTLRLTVLEKEGQVGAHQTGHNSGVIHSGIYYAPGSLKARLCVRGRSLLLKFLEERSIRHELTGKLIVATSDRERPALERLAQRGVANGVDGVRQLNPREIREIEPEVRGVRGLAVAATGIVDYGEVARAYAEELRQHGAELRLNEPLLGAVVSRASVTLETPNGRLEADHVVNCAGLYSDRVAELLGDRPSVRIVPFRGEYRFLRDDAASRIRGLVYPVPDPETPFLGVHLTRTIHGRVEAGPNAVLAFAREGYKRSTVRWKDLGETLTFAGTPRLAARYWRNAIGEWGRSLSPSAFAGALARLVPFLREEHLAPGGAGVRAQALRRDGTFVDDFVIDETPHATHVLNAPSPAATASLAIGEEIAGRVIASLR